jgi:hypothetical protein
VGSSDGVAEEVIAATDIDNHITAKLPITIV